MGLAPGSSTSSLIRGPLSGVHGLRAFGPPRQSAWGCAAGLCLGASTAASPRNPRPRRISRLSPLSARRGYKHSHKLCSTRPCQRVALGDNLCQRWTRRKDRGKHEWGPEKEVLLMQTVEPVKAEAMETGSLLPPELGLWL